MITLGNYDYLWNVFVLFIGAFVALFVSLATERRSVMVAIGAVFVSISLIITIFQNFSFPIADGNILLSGFSKLFFIAILIPGLLSVIGMSKSPLSKKPGLMIFIFLISLGFMLLAIASYNLLFIFVAFEGVSIPTYVLAAYGKSDNELEAAIKYFIVGAFSTGLIIFGISLYYVATGTLSLGATPSFHSIYYLAMGLLVFGFGFKLAIFPLHGWAIDTYTGASNPVSSYLSTSSKIMTLIVLLNILFASPLFFNYLKILFAIITILTMTFGNVVAISQNNVKRMLAYSSIAQAGYLSVVFLVAGTGAIDLAVISLFMYALAYGFMKAGSFLAMDSLGNYDIENFSGMWKRNPAFAVSFAVLLLSLAGFPGTLGFIGKYFLFLSVLSTGTPLAYLVVIISVINSVVSFYYYGRVIIYMFWREGVKEKVANNYLLYSSAFFTVLFGVLYFLVFSYAQSIFPSVLTHFMGGI